MILPMMLFLLAVAGLVGLLHVESLISQICLAWLVVALIAAFTQTCTDESIAERRAKQKPTQV